MKNDQIGKILKKYRKINLLSVNDVVIELEERYGVNVAEKTIYGWESSQAHPTAPMLIALCDIYKINNIAEVFSDQIETKGFPITQEERHLVEQYRRNEDLQPVIRKILDL
jgi:hypothetical protein